MDHDLKSYIRPLRRRFGFTQKEIAFLIGAKCRTAISRLEGATRKPSLEAAFIFALLFDTTPSELFPGLMLELHEITVRRANDLYDELQGNPSNTTQFKLDFLERLLERAEKRALRAV
ncbi:helix-turn-helix transcriptional regulator [Bradyrhizobium sp. 197]|uniref:helix-turn-helix transcriptional regulator n=1 Tax=Bradyrhizobium sp. 197 TaxID=2782663 RepID=UPI001FFAD7F4|nr:helix-turn-helix transcriptional regulator [Bradyrhizobium sp. 197]MCK1481006.1 helix-turn-helix transcriptional regulator [Bradyrhizobium sp. 197]